MPSVRFWAWIFCSQTLSTKPKKKASTQIKAMGMDFLATMNIVLLWAWRQMGGAAPPPPQPPRFFFKIWLQAVLEKVWLRGGPLVLRSSGPVVSWSCGPSVRCFLWSAGLVLWCRRAKHTRRGRPDNNAEEGLTRRKHNQSRRVKKICKWGDCAPPNPPRFFFYSELSAHESHEEMQKSVFADTHERVRGFNRKHNQSRRMKNFANGGGCAPPNPPALFVIVNSPLTKAAKRCTKACLPTHTKGKA